MLSHLRTQEEVWEAGKNGQKLLQLQLMETVTSSALEVLVHAIQHLSGQEVCNEKTISRIDLEQLIAQVKAMFEEDVKNPERSQVKRKSIEEIPILYKGSV